MNLKVASFFATFSVCIFLLTGSTNAQYTEKWSCCIDDDRYLFLIDFKTELLDFNGDSCPEIIWTYCCHISDTYKILDNEGKSYDTCFDYIWDDSNSNILWSTPPDWSIDDFGNTDDDPYPEVISCHRNCVFGNCIQFQILDSRTGEIEWSYHSSARDRPILVDIDHDDIDEILFIEGDYIRCYEYANGNMSHEENSRNEITLEEFELKQIQTIGYEILERSKVLITIKDMSSRIVDILVDEVKPPGKYNAVWDIRNVGTKTMSDQSIFDIPMVEGIHDLITGGYFLSIKASSIEDPFSKVDESKTEIFLLRFNKEG